MTDERNYSERMMGVLLAADALEEWADNRLTAGTNATLRAAAKDLRTHSGDVAKRSTNAAPHPSPPSD